MNKKDILTVDADAHLRKLASNYYRSAVLNIVELIRTAFKRNALSVKIKLNNRQVIVEDNGDGLTDSQLDCLQRISDKRKSQIEKEEEIISYINTYGIDVLVLFSFLPLDVRIENSYRNKQTTLHLKQNVAVAGNDCNRQYGTRFSITRKSRNVKYEIQIISEYCRQIGDKVEINGKAVPQKSIISNSIVSIQASAARERRVEVGIGQNGHICKLWTLSFGIPVSLKSFSDESGLVYEIAQEVRSGETGMPEVNDSVHRLYDHLVNKFDQYPDEIRKRIRELIFRHFNVSGSLTFLKKMRSFRVIGGSINLRLPDILQLAEDQTLHVVSDSERRSLARMNSPVKTVLLLDQMEIDLLMNGFNLNLRYLRKNQFRDVIRRGWTDSVWKYIKIVLSRLISSNRSSIQSEIEKDFIHDLGTTLSSHVLFKYRFPASKTIRIILLDQKLPILSYSNIKGEKVVIYLARRHRVFDRMLHFYKSDPRNLDWMIPQLIQ